MFCETVSFTIPLIRNCCVEFLLVSALNIVGRFLVLISDLLVICLTLINLVVLRLGLQAKKSEALSDWYSQVDGH